MLWQAFGRWGGLQGGGTEGGGAGSTPSAQAISPLAVNTGAFSSDPVEVEYPGGLQANDIAFIHAVLNDASTTTNSINTPSGWTQVTQTTVGGTGFSETAVFWKRLTGSESGTVPVSAAVGHSSSDAFGAVMTIWRGAIATGTPYESLASNGGNNTSMNGAAVTTTGANRTILHFGATRGAATATPASGYNEEYDYTHSVGVNLGLKLYTIARPSAGTQSAATHPLAWSSRWQVFSLGLIPA